MLQHIVVLTPIFVTLFWAIVFLSEYNARHRARHALGFFMFVAAEVYLCHAFFFLGHINAYLNVDALYVASSLSLYPMYYIYCKHLTSEVRYRMFNLVHFIPAMLLGLLMLLAHVNSSAEQRLLYFNQALVANQLGTVFNGGESGWLAAIHYSARLVYFAQILYYGTKTIGLIQWYNKRLSIYFSNLESRHLRWMNVVTIVLMVISIVGIIANVVGRGNVAANPTALLGASMLFSALLFLLGLMGNRQRSSLWELYVEGAMANDGVDSVVVRKGGYYREKVRNQLNGLMREEELFLQADLSLAVLCKKMNVSQQFLIALILEEYGEDFHSFINRYRISCAKMALKSDKWLPSEPLDVLAVRCGFQSLGAFQKAFKQIEGIDFEKYVHIHLAQPLH